MNLVLLAGPPASGKSAFARYLQGRFDGVVIAKDDIKERLFDTVGFKSYDEKRALDRCATEIMYLLAESVLKSGGTAVLDNNFEKSSKPGLEKLVRKFDIVPLTVRFEGDMGEIYKRYVRRESSPRRHRGHICRERYPEKKREKTAPLKYEEFVRRYTERGMTDFVFGRLITVDCTVPRNIDYKELLKKICGETSGGR